MLISEALKLAIENLKQKGVDSPRIDAILLLGQATSFSREQIIFNSNFELTLDQEKHFFELVKKRENRQPISHILGKREFYSNDFFVNSDVLDPRPDSESLVDLVFEIFPEKSFSLKVLELGVGSGCLISTIVKYFPNATGIGVDISDKALAIAGKNAHFLNIADRLQLIESNWFSNLKNEKFDLIISNPPYIKTSDINFLQDEVKNFEPHLALDGGTEGLDCYEEISKNARSFLKEEGSLVVEIGKDQESDIIKIFEKSGLKFMRQKADLGGIVRCLFFKNSKNTVSA